LADITVYGAPWCPDCRRTKTFFGEHRVAYDWIDVDKDAEALEYMMGLQGGGRSIPTVVFPDDSHLIEPSNEELARKLGLQLEPECRFYDLAIVGGGPAGLAAALYAAREGIETIVLDRSALGGQAGVTERIDNYPGFPAGVGGAELADRIVEQVRRNDVELLSAVSVERLERQASEVGLHLGSGGPIAAHAALIATGSSFRRLDVPGEDRLIGAGVHFCATCDGPFYKGADELMVVGGGNSGFEESLFLAQFADRIRIVVRGSEPRASALLQAKVADHPRISVHLDTEVAELRGRGRVDEVIVRSGATGETQSWRPAGVFVYIGLAPNTDFLREHIDLDEWGFVKTDPTFQTSMPGVFAGGDVRAGSTKQLGAAIGDGIAAVLMVRQYLQAHSHLSSTSPSA
jgi:thioredoxin reductase (NADPH)